MTELEKLAIQQAHTLTALFDLETVSNCPSTTPETKQFTVIKIGQLKDLLFIYKEQVMNIVRSEVKEILITQ